MVTRQDFRLDSGGIPLAATFFVPPGPGPHPALVICHGMPAGPRPDPGASDAPAAEEGLEYPGLAEWCAWEGFATLIFNFRGTGDSGGNFHAMGWAQDADAVVSWILSRPEVDPARVILLGSSMGATIAIYTTANRPEVAGLVSFAGPAASRPRAEPAEAVERMRTMGIIRDPDFPPNLEEWANEGVALSPSEWIGKVAPRPLCCCSTETPTTWCRRTASTSSTSARVRARRCRCCRAWGIASAARRRPSAWRWSG